MLCPIILLCLKGLFLMTLSKNPYKGTRDFLPQDKRYQDYLFEKMHKAAKSFGYEHYDGPLLEEVELYKAKSGEELINDQIYSFVDRGERFVAIRPEMTPTLARMIAKVHREVSKPIRWYSIPNLYRYERPQRGRLREHWQFNCDIFGAPEGKGELEIVQLAIFFLESLGASEEHFEVLFNDRRIIDQIFKKISKDEATVYRLYKIVDKSKKVAREGLEKEVSELSLLDGGKLSFFKYLDIKSSDELLDFLNEIKLEKESEQFSKFLENIKLLNLNNYLKFDPTIVRGLDYYTGIVFEIFDKHPDNRRAVSGGGAYANLLEIFNEKPLPGVGFGLGDVTLLDFLKSHDLLPDLTKPNHELLISYQIEEGHDILCPLALDLRKKNVSTVMTFSPIKFNKLFKEAEKKGIKFVTIFGDEERNKNIIILKNIESKEQKEFNLNQPEEIISFLKYKQYQ